MKKLITLLFIPALIFSAYGNIKTINFATEATYPPFEYFSPAGKIQGFDVDVMNALCKQIDAKCTITHQPFDSLIPSLKLGKFDAIIASLGITPAREKQVSFTDPYYFNTASFVAAKSTNLTISKAGLQGKTIGVQGGTTFANYLSDVYGKVVTIKIYASNEDALLDLKNGRIDAFLGDTPLSVIWLKKPGSSSFAIIGKHIVSKKYFGSGDGIAVKKGNTKLLQALNKAIAKIKANGTLAKIQHKYFKTE